MKCYMCNKEINEDEKSEEEGVCSTCYAVMEKKYSKSKKLNARLKCHKEQAKKLKQKQ